MAISNTRILKETQRILADPGNRCIPNQLSHLLSVFFHLLSVPGVSATPYEDNMRYFNVVIAGPSDSPYEGLTDA